MFKSVWKVMSESPKVIEVDTKKPTLTEDCRVLSIPKLLEMSRGIVLDFEGYDEGFDGLSDEELAKDDPRDDICDAFAEQQAISYLKSQVANSQNNDKSSAGDVSDKQSQADTASSDEVGK